MLLLLTAGAIKAFAREVCRNDVLNFGRLHFFFPDSRLSLDLNTDRTLKEARFDRHFVRDLTWSRHQLEELAERRFRAAQEALQAEAQANGKTTELMDTSNTTFADLFRKVLVKWGGAAMMVAQSAGHQSGWGGLEGKATRLVLWADSHANDSIT